MLAIVEFSHPLLQLGVIQYQNFPIDVYRKDTM